MLYRVTQIASRSLSIWIDIELIMIQSIKLLFNWHCCSRAVANKSFIWQIDAQQNNIDIHIILKGNCPPRYVHTFFRRERERMTNKMYTLFNIQYVTILCAQSLLSQHNTLFDVLFSITNFSLHRWFQYKNMQTV